LLLQRIHIPKAFPLKIYLVYLMPSEPKVPVIAVDALEDPLFRVSRDAAKNSIGVKIPAALSRASF
jgi:hypothetical protein